MPVRAISCKVQKGLKWNLDRWRWEEGQYTRTIILPNIFTELSPLKHSLFHNGWLSEPYLGKYTRDSNETWFIDRWQWVEGLCTRTITLPCILLSYLSVTIFFIMVACLGHVLESTKGIEIKLGTYIDVNKRKWRRQEP